MVKRFIYNLVFPNYITELKLGDYKFKRISDYAGAFAELQHLVSGSGSEFSTKIQTGSHQITAVVEIPDKEKPCILPWQNKNTTRLSDVLLLLTLFTGRNVFQKDWSGNENIAIVQDHRLHLWGAQLLLSINNEFKWKHRETGHLYSDNEINGNLILDYIQVDIGFEKTINQVLNLISTNEWKEKYEAGYFLFLFRQAIQRQVMETSFISCWSIWEHIFALHNRKWLDKKTIETLSGYEKISFILNQYFLINIDKKARQEIGRLAKTRNRIIHFGKKTEDIDYKEMEMFIRLTEQLMAIILGLQPSNAFNSIEALNNFLKKQVSQKKGDTSVQE